MYLAWFDNDRKRTLAQKIQMATVRYEQKFGESPMVCLLHPLNHERYEPKEGDGVTVALVPRANVGRHCFWIGKDGE